MYIRIASAGLAAVSFLPRRRRRIGAAVASTRHRRHRAEGHAAGPPEAARREALLRVRVAEAAPAAPARRRRLRAVQRVGRHLQQPLRLGLQQHVLRRRRAGLAAGGGFFFPRGCYYWCYPSVSSPPRLRTSNVETGPIHMYICPYCRLYSIHIPWAWTWTRWSVTERRAKRTTVRVIVALSAMEFLVWMVRWFLGVAQLASTVYILYTPTRGRTIGVGMLISSGLEYNVRGGYDGGFHSFRPITPLFRRTYSCAFTFAVSLACCILVHRTVHRFYTR
jgi:hypothetical protein